MTDIDLAEFIAPPESVVGQLPEMVGLDVLLQMTPAESLLGELLYRDTLAQLEGPSGSFKSFVAVGMCCAVASGKPWGQHQVTQRSRVLYIAAEGGKGVGQRAAAWCRHYDIDPSELYDWFRAIPEPIQLGDETHVLHLLGVVEQWRPELVVIDTRARSTVGLEENSATDQGRAIDSAERVRRSVNCTVLVVHHTGVKGTQRGTTAWPAAVWSELDLKRTGLNLDASGEPLGVTATVQKHKDAENPGPKSFDMVPVEVPAEWMPNASDPRQRRTLVAVPTDEPHTSVLGLGQRRAERSDALLAWGEWLRGQYAETGRVPSRDAPESKTWRKDNGVKASAQDLGAVVQLIKSEVAGG